MTKKLLLLLFIGQASLLMAFDKSIIFPYKWNGDIEKDNKEKLNEPSGIIYHQSRSSLFAVGDEGDIFEFSLKGKIINKKTLKNVSFEGITYHPQTGILYAVIEGEDSILEILPDSLDPQRKFHIPRSHLGKTILHERPQGLEAITFIPNEKHPEGGTFVVGNQSFTLNNPDDESALIELELSLKNSSKTQVKILRHFPMPFIDIAGLEYHSQKNIIYAVSDATNTLHQVTRNGKVIKSQAFPGNDQEGITIDKNGNVYIAQDSGGILKYSPSGE